MLSRVDDQNAATTAAAIQSFEAKNRITLPNAYKIFLLNINGGRPTPDNFPIANLANNQFGRIQFLYGLGARHPTVDLDIVLNEYTPSSVPHGILPIGCTGYEGTQIVIDLRDPGEPVKYFDSIPFWGNNIWNESYLYPVAADFAALLASLKTDEEVDLTVRASSEN